MAVTQRAVKRDGQTREWVMYGSGLRFFGCLKDVISVPVLVIFLRPVLTTSPVSVDDELVCDFLPPWNFHSSDKTNVALDQMNGRGPLQSEGVSGIFKKVR